ncbi:MAG: response regulator transcription factor [Thermomicrobiales bacterium]
MISRLETRSHPHLEIAAPSQTPRARSGPSRLVVGIVAAYPSLRAGLASLLQTDIALTPSAIAPESLGSFNRTPSVRSISDADVIIIEPTDLDRDALANLVTIAQEESVPLVWLGRPNGELARSVVGHAGGILSPHAEGETLVAAIRAAAAGLSVHDPAQHIEHATDASSSQASLPGVDGFLSPREREVLGLVAAGLPNKAIAHELGISDHTVKFHVSSLLTKLGAASRTEAVTVATRMGVLSL